MPPQTHVIRRNIVEVTVAGKANCRSVQDAVSRVLRGKLAPLLQRCCDELGEPGTICRIDRLEIDLGRIPLADFEDQLSHALNHAALGPLTEAVRSAENAAGGRRLSQLASHLELADFFVRTGTLPWWADHRRRPHAFADSLRFLSREAAPELRAWLASLPREDDCLRRMVRACTDDDLHGVLVALQPDDADLLRRLAEMLLHLPPESGVANSQQTRHRVWQSILGATIMPGAPSGHTALLRDILHRLRDVFDPYDTGLITALTRSTDVRDRELAASLDTILAGPRDQPSSARDLSAGLFAAVAGFSERASGPLHAALQALREKFEASTSISDEVSSPPLDDLRIWLCTALDAGALPARVLRVWLSESEPHTRASEALTACVRATLATVRPLAPEEVINESFGSAFSKSDALYIENAGLVLLWPFLEHFFNRLDLLDENQFKDATASHRAAGLLQFLLTADRTPPEYHLPLNKVLCGIALEDVFDFGPPVTDDEAAECEAFLSAVIEGAPILDHMSLPGFRGTFLARNGQLSTRDGAWLLRVERETYDVVLERFPWTFQWVRLPWMETPLYVEW